MQGVVRTAILTTLGADFERFAKGEPCVPDANESLRDELGDATTLGRLSLEGPFLARGGELLFPLPMDVVPNERAYDLLTPGPVVECDLGRVRLPHLAAAGQQTGADEGRPSDDLRVPRPHDGYVRHTAMQELLAGRTDGLRVPTKPREGRIQRRRYSEDEANATLWSLLPDDESAWALADREWRTGLARDNRTRQARTGMLYSIAPIRPREGVEVAVVVGGIASERHPAVSVVQRFGGEGKLAVIRTAPVPPWPPVPALRSEGLVTLFRMILTTPARLTTSGWLPPGFVQDDSGEFTVWRGQLEGIELAILSGCVDKPVRIGGWDLARRRPRELQPFTPAGAVYFCETRAPAAAVAALHGARIGQCTEYGFGHVLIGSW